tara:strand:- start:67 stop:351 length:285 start_codon:yes stop_codon:yes gene_type:complete
MKRLQLPKNKFLKLLINVFLFLVCNVLFNKIFSKPIDNIVFNFVQRYDIGDWSFYTNLSDFVIEFIGIIQLIVITRLVWFRRVFPAPRITRSKD